MFVIVVGCATSGTGVYQPPSTEVQPRSSFERTINTAYDRAWEAIIDYVSESFFAIESYEKDSGLITLSFGSARPEVYVDCGHLQYERQQRPGVVISRQGGPFVAHLREQFDGSLTGRLNISARAVSETATRVRVNARSVLSSTVGTWAFDSGSAGTVGDRTCVPTGAAEGAILSGVEAIAR